MRCVREVSGEDQSAHSLSEYKSTFPINGTEHRSP
jgi:hypothetical protein